MPRMIIRPKPTQLWRPHVWIPHAKFAPGYPCCCEPTYPCTAACTDGGPDDWSITLGGSISNSAGCTNCASYLDTWTASRYIEGDYACLWRYYWDPAICGTTAAYLNLSMQSGPYAMEVTVQAPGTEVTWRKTFVSKPDCKSIASLNVPYFSQFGYWCNWPSVTCTVTAL